MRCGACKYTKPYEASDDRRCPSCPKGTLQITAEDWLGEPKMGLVREVRPGQITLGNIIEDAIQAEKPQIVIAQGGCGVGKAQPLDAHILCPDRWRFMGAMEVGMPILGRDGRAHRVTGVFPQGVREVFRVTFTDGSATTCCAEHLWRVQNKKDRAKRRPGRVRQLLDLLTEGLKQGREHRHWIPMMDPAVFTTAPLPLDPYLLGVLLGDGGFTAGSAVAITKADVDVFIIDELRCLVPKEDHITRDKDGRYHIISRTVGPWVRSRTTDILEDLGLWEHLSIEKFIPETYLWASIEDRLRLLQGLCDTDGGNVTANVEYSSSSSRLAEGVSFLVQSLGGITSFKSRIPHYTHNGERREGHENHRLVFTLPPTINPFRLPRKRDAYHTPTKYLPRRAIAHVERLGPCETQCISTSAPDQLYVTDDFIVTHNTFSYLVPALLSGRRVIVGTAKKSLQGQLDSKDLPYLKEHMLRPNSFTSVKGRNNYLCRLYLQKNKKLFGGEEALYKRLDEFLRIHPTGDLDAFPGGVRYPATLCTASECVGKSCTHATDCGFRKTKARAKVDQVVIVNHALLGFDLKFGPQRLFGEYDILVIDEAHAAEDFFRGAFSHELSTNWMHRVLKDMHHQNITLLDTSIKSAERAWQAIFAQVPDAQVLPCGFFGDLTTVQETLTDLLHSVEEYVTTQWPAMTGVPLTEEGLQDAVSRLGDDQNEVLICAKLATKVSEMKDVLQASEDPDDNMIRVREELKEGFKVVMKPIDIGRRVGPKLASLKTVILTSATLHGPLIAKDLGITATVTVNEPSPFNYKANGLVYIPKTVPNPSDLKTPEAKHEWVAQISREIVQLITTSNGNALVLFTSLKEMSEVLAFMDDNYEVEQAIFAQEAGRRPDEVFADFMKTDNSVLFGSKSFFEGVDVQGEKLRLVILTKLPFPIWGDPVVQAKKQQLGQLHFAQYYLPKMFVDLMQAAGRLIRTQHDRGVFAILDVRMWVGSNKNIDPELIKINGGQWPGYGSKAFQQLPFTNVTPNFATVKKFLEHIQTK
jgi:Rad3-related DNA helicase